MSKTSKWGGLLRVYMNYHRICVIYEKLHHPPPKSNRYHANLVSCTFFTLDMCIFRNSSVYYRQITIFNDNFIGWRLLYYTCVASWCVRTIRSTMIEKLVCHAVNLECRQLFTLESWQGTWLVYRNWNNDFKLKTHKQIFSFLYFL